MRGKIIVIEGTDCSGKNTQAKLLSKQLQAQGIKSVCLSFPMYDTPTGKIIGESLLGRNSDSKCLFPEGSVKVDPKISCLYYAADRKYNFPKIEKYLNDGYYIVLDRYVSSNMAHQGSKIDNSTERFNFFRWIDKLEYWLLELPKPDITIYLHVPFKFTKELMKNRTDLDQVEKDDDHLIKSEQTYIELAELYHWDIINCVNPSKDELKSVAEINTEILNIVTNKNN